MTFNGEIYTDTTVKPWVDLRKNGDDEIGGGGSALPPVTPDPDNTPKTGDISSAAAGSASAAELRYPHEYYRGKGFNNVRVIDDTTAANGKVCLRPVLQLYFLLDHWCFIHAITSHQL